MSVLWILLDTVGAGQWCFLSWVYIGNIKYWMLGGRQRHIATGFLIFANNQAGIGLASIRESRSWIDRVVSGPDYDPL
jgi:hypothetical protein